MDGIALGLNSNVDNTMDVEITLYRVRPDKNGLISLFNMQGMAVRLGIDRYRLNAQLTAGANNANRALTTIGNQNAFKQLKNLLSGSWIIPKIALSDKYGIGG
jgi:hypothetical protein